MRKLLTEAVWRGVSRTGRLQEVFQRHLKGDKGRRKLALVATAHWLTRVMLAMLRSGEIFRESTTAPVGTTAPGSLPAQEEVGRVPHQPPSRCESPLGGTPISAGPAEAELKPTGKKRKKQLIKDAT